MFNLALTIQVLAAITCLISVIIVAFQKPSSYSNIILTTFVCALVQNEGYILELTARDIGTGMIAVKAEYLGGAFEICLITFFMFKYCGHEFSFTLKAMLIFEECIVLVGVWSWEYTHMYYKSVEFVADDVIPHLSMEHGWLYFVFAVITILELIGSIFILSVSILKTNQEHMKRNYVILLFVVLIPLIAFVLSITGVFGGWDITPLGAATAVGVFGAAISKKHVFDVADTAGELIISNLENAIIILNNEDGYEYSNKRAKELFPGLISHKKGEILRINEIKNFIKDTNGGSITLNDRNYDVSINKVRVSDEEIGTTIILFDTTDAMNQMEQMKELIKEAEDANRSNAMFLTNVSYEIRTPINIIMGMSEILLRDHSNSGTKEYLMNIRNSGSTLLNLINDIIDFSKIETGKLEIKNSRFDIKRVLSELVNINEFRCSQKGIDFEHDIAAQIPRYLIGDELRVRQIATNLLSNAVKFTDEGVIKLRMGYKYRNDYNIDLILAVEDTGVGIRHEDYDKLFTGFGRDNMKTVRQSDGTGLGLNITKQIVELMGGFLNFKSEVGKGSVFSVVIPLIVPTDSLETIGEITGEIIEEEAFHPGFSAKEAEILIVDDSETSIELMEELLKEMKPKVSYVTSGEDCLELVRNKHFDLIFMDDRMRGMGGVETFSRIKQSENECQGVPVVMITANATSDARDWYLSKGFSDFLLKPVNSEQISQMLYKYLPEEFIIMNQED